MLTANTLIHDVDELLNHWDVRGPIATELGCTLAQLAIAWCAANPNVSTVITGASRASQVLENFEALNVLPLLNADVMQRIDAVLA